MKTLTLILVTMILPLARADFLPGIAVENLKVIGTDATISFQRKDGAVWIGDIDKKFNISEKLVDTSHAPYTFDALCEIADRGGYAKFPLALPFHLYPVSADAISKTVGTRLINPPSLIYVVGVEIELKEGATSLNQKNESIQGTKSQIEKYLESQLQYQGNTLKNLDPVMDVSKLTSLNCDLYRGKAAIHIWTRINIPRVHLDTIETLTESEVGNLYGAINQKPIANSAKSAIFGLRLYQASKQLSYVKKVESLGTSLFSSLAAGFFDESQGVIRSLNGSDLKSLAEAVRKPDLTSSTMLLEIVENAHGN